MDQFTDGEYRTVWHRLTDQNANGLEPQSAGSIPVASSPFTEDAEKPSASVASTENRRRRSRSGSPTGEPRESATATPLSPAVENTESLPEGAESRKSQSRRSRSGGSDGWQGESVTAVPLSPAGYPMENLPASVENRENQPRRSRSAAPGEKQREDSTMALSPAAESTEKWSANGASGEGLPESAESGKKQPHGKGGKVIHPRHSRSENTGERKNNLTIENPLTEEASDGLPQSDEKNTGKSQHNLWRTLLLALCVVVFCVSFYLLARYFGDIIRSEQDSRAVLDLYQQLKAEEGDGESTATSGDTGETGESRKTGESEESEAMQTGKVEQTGETSETAESNTPAFMPWTVAAVPDENVASDENAASGVAAGSATAASAGEEENLWPTEYAGNRGLRISSTFFELQKQNSDIVAYIKIDGVLEEPVVQRNNTYYLTHSVAGKKSVTGAIFLEESCDLKKVPVQYVVYGHNMKEGAMFGALKKYKVKDHKFYSAHPFITFDTQYETGEYVIFAVCEVDIRPGQWSYLPFCYRTSFTAESFREYINEIHKISQLKCDIEVVPGDRLLTLCTCVNEDSNKRLLVIARKLREGEDRLSLNMQIMSSMDR